jgi:hypothetical protein
MFRDITGIIKWLKIYVIGSLALFALVGILGIVMIYQRSVNDRRLTDEQAKVYQSQVKVFEAQAKNVGAPQIIEQRYFSPQGK